MFAGNVIDRSMNMLKWSPMRIPTRLKPLLLMILLLILAACQEKQLAPTPPATQPVQSATEVESSTTVSTIPEATKAEPQAVATAVAGAAQDPSLPAAVVTDIQQLPSAMERATLTRLLQNDLPVRDDIALLEAFAGVLAEVVPPPLVGEPLPAGSRQSFQTLNFATNEIVTVEAVFATC